MHVPPNISTPIAIVSAALWCAAAVTAITVGPSRNNAPLAASIEPEPLPVRIIPIVVHPVDSTLSFADRYAVVPPAPVPLSVTTTIAEEPPARSMKQVKQTDDESPRRRAHAEVRDICERHGMHKHYTHGGRSWRCRR
jgi:hypothetical protein